MAWRVPDTSARSATPVTLITVRVLVPVARMTVPVGPSPSPRRTTPLARIVTLPATAQVQALARAGDDLDLGLGQGVAQVDAVAVAEVAHVPRGGVRDVEGLQVGAG